MKAAEGDGRCPAAGRRSSSASSTGSPRAIEQTEKRSAAVLALAAPVGAGQTSALLADEYSRGVDRRPFLQSLSSAELRARLVEAYASDPDKAQILRDAGGDLLTARRLGPFAVAESDRSLPPPPPAGFRYGMTVQEFLWNGLVDAAMYVELYERYRGAVGPRRPTVLDFGCGTGRVARYLNAAQDAWRLFGFEVDPSKARWCRDNLPYIEVTVGSRFPPCGYPDRHFDYVYSHSVFTHLGDAAAQAWLGELRRVMAPGAVIAFTTSGARLLDHMKHEAGSDNNGRTDKFGFIGGISAEEVEALRDEMSAYGYALKNFGWTGPHAETVGADYGWLFVTPERITRCWAGHDFEALDYQSGSVLGQDITVLRAR